MDASKFEQFFKSAVYSQDRTKTFGDLSYLLNEVCADYFFRLLLTLCCAEL